MIVSVCLSAPECGSLFIGVSGVRGRRTANDALLPLCRAICCRRLLLAIARAWSSSPLL